MNELYEKWQQVRELGYTSLTFEEWYSSFVDWIFEQVRDGNRTSETKQL